MNNYGTLPVVDIQASKHFLCQPVPPQSHHELPAVLSEVGFRQTGLPAKRYHVQRARPRFFYVVGQIKGVGNQWITRDGSVRQAQQLWRQGRRKLTRIPDFEPIGEKHNLYTGIAGVVAMSHGVDNGFCYGFLGQFIFHGRLGTVLAGANRPGDLGHNAVDGLVYQFEDSTLEDLVGRDRFADLRAVKVQTLDLRCRQESLRVIAKKKDRGMRWVFAVQKVQMGQCLFGRGSFG